MMKTVPLHRRWIAAAALIVALGGPATAEAAPGVVKLADTQLDPTALFFVSFDGLVNNASYQQSAILSHAGFSTLPGTRRAAARWWRAASCPRAPGRPSRCHTS